MRRAPARPPPPDTVVHLQVGEQVEEEEVQEEEVEEDEVLFEIEVGGDLAIEGVTGDGQDIEVVAKLPHPALRHLHPRHRAPGQPRHLAPVGDDGDAGDVELLLAVPDHLPQVGAAPGGLHHGWLHSLDQEGFPAREVDLLHAGLGEEGEPPLGLLVALVRGEGLTSMGSRKEVLAVWKQKPQE